ncbi:MAG: hypothetical protein H6Q70_4621 [Firmicutes bacterium]|nr:hypothetical protein [Bacillota bacterium]
MATVGEKLTAPETGWTRYDDTDSNISYSATWSYAEDSLYYNGHRYSTTKKGDQVKFNFMGTKLRIIGAYNYHDSNNVEIVIDKETHNISVYGPSIICGALVFEIEDLSLCEHSVTITNLEDGKYCTFVAIDIDETGELKPYNPDIKTEEALLRVTMLDSSERDYQLSTTEIDGFINWYMKHTSTDTTGYMLTKKVGTEVSKEYLTLDKIISFEVIER